MGEERKKHILRRKRGGFHCGVFHDIEIVAMIWQESELSFSSSGVLVGGLLRGMTKSKASGWYSALRCNSDSSISRPPVNQA